MAVERRHDMGPFGYCVCPKCEKKFPHGRGVKCQEERCPECGAKMLREGSYHYQLWLEKKEKRKHHDIDTRKGWRGA